MTALSEETLASLSINEQGYLRALRTYLTSPPQDWRSEACLGIMGRTLAVLEPEQKARVQALADALTNETLATLFFDDAPDTERDPA